MIFAVRDAYNIAGSLVNRLGLQNMTWSDFEIEDFYPGGEDMSIDTYRLHVGSFTNTIGVGNLSEDRIGHLYQRYTSNIKELRSNYANIPVVDIVYRYAQPMDENFIFRPVEFTKTIGSYQHYKDLLTMSYPLLDITEVDTIKMYKRLRSEFETLGVPRHVTESLGSYTVVDQAQLYQKIASIGVSRHALDKVTNDAESMYIVKFVTGVIIKFTNYPLDLSFNIAKKYLGKMEDDGTIYKIHQVYPRVNKVSSSGSSDTRIDSNLMELLRG